MLFSSSLLFICTILCYATRARMDAGCIPRPKMAQSLILIKGRCGDCPESICRKNGVEGAGADTNNLSTLISILKNNNVDSAYVNGWNGTPGNFVLRANGALAPYNPLTNDTEYAFCYKECPCPPYGEQMRSQKPVFPPQQVVCPPQQVICPQPRPVFCPQPVICPQPRPVFCPQPKPCIPKPCKEESDCNVELYDGKCKMYPNKIVCVKRECKKLPCGDRICLEKQKIRTTRHFEVCANGRINSRSGDRRIKVKVTENSNSCDVKFVELSRKIREGGFHKKCLYPNWLRCPEKLACFFKYLAQTYCTRPCFYIGGEHCDELFVELNCELFRVMISPKEFCCGRIPYERIRLCPVFGRELHHLIEKGLALVTVVVPNECD